MRCLWVEFLVATHDDWPGPVVQWSRHRSHQTLMLFMFDSGADQAQGYTWDLQTKKSVDIIGGIGPLWQGWQW